FFGAFRLATVIPSWLLFVPAEVAALPYSRSRRITLLRRSLALGTGPSLLAAPLVTVAWVFVLVFGGSSVDSSTLIAFSVSGIAAAFLSPIQDHVRRMLHLADRSWRAASVSVVQLLSVVVAVGVLQSTSIGDAWIPFGALAIANAISLPAGLILSLGEHDRITERLHITELFRSGRWLLTQELTFSTGDFLVIGIVYILAGPLVAGYAEAARQAARPLAVTAEGLRAVLGPRSMESGSTVSPARARAISRTFSRWIMSAGVAYLAMASFKWVGNPLAYIDKLSGAYVVTGLVAVTIIANIVQGLMESPRAELIGGGAEEEMARIEWSAAASRLGVAATSGVTGGFAVPISMIAMYGVRWLGYSKELDRLYTPPGTHPQGEKPRVVIFAYACEPGRGSEPGAGWGLVQSVARFAECTVLVGPEHTDAIKAWETENPRDNLTFIEVPEPRWAMWLPHEPTDKSRRHLMGYFTSYLGWQRRAARMARRLHQEEPFDVAYHATYSVYWMPSPGDRLGIPLVWGPVGGAVVTPWRMWPALGVKGMASEAFDLVAVKAFSYVPSTRKNWRRARVRILQNEETRRRLTPRPEADILLNHVLFSEVDRVPRQREDFILFLSSFESRKGVRLALHGLANADPSVHMVVVGDGPERKAVNRLVDKLGIGDRVELRGWIPYDDAQDLLDRACAVLFSGVREEGGIALAEAMLRGAPVIVLANGGAKTIAEAGIDQSRVSLVPPGSRQSIAAGLGEAMTRFHASPIADNSPNLDTEAAHETLHHAFEVALNGRESKDLQERILAESRLVG
ncbi:MAG: glycosyltransferase, partial [Acidimicrobiia bacterium]